MDKSEHLSYWKDMAIDDLETAKSNIIGGRNLAALFFFHLSIEKMLKAHWVKSNVANIPPFTHDLPKICAETSLVPSLDQYDYLSVVGNWNIETRYPDYKLKLKRMANEEYLDHHLSKVEALFQWLLSQL